MLNHMLWTVELKEIQTVEITASFHQAERAGSSRRTLSHLFMERWLDVKIRGSQKFMMEAGMWRDLEHRFSNPVVQ